MSINLQIVNIVKLTPYPARDTRLDTRKIWDTGLDTVSKANQNKPTATKPKRVSPTKSGSKQRNPNRNSQNVRKLAEGVGFEPTVGLLLLLISSQRFNFEPAL